MKKIIIIGAGKVGSHIVYSSMHKNTAANFILVDLCDSYEEAQVMDLRDSLPLFSNIQIETGDLTDKKVRTGDIFIITAGAKQKDGEKRTDLLKQNIKILRDIKKDLGELKKTAIVIIVTNPVDILTQKASSIFNLPAGQVFGSGTSLDNLRLKVKLSEVKDSKNKNIFNKDSQKIDSAVFGEHGDSSFVAWSLIKNSSKLSEEQRIEIETWVREKAYKIIFGKGSTFFGIASAVSNMIEIILKDEKKEVFVSTPLNGEYGFNNVSAGVPVILSKMGIEKIIEKRLSKSESCNLKNSIDKMKKFL